MNKPIKISRCGFVVIKLQIAGDNYFLLRKNKRWKDLNFIGGHVEPRDCGSLRRAARRELLEEVPALRATRSFTLEPITDEFGYGPIFSKSADCEVQYELQVFLVKFLNDPEFLLKGLGPRSSNVLIRESQMFDQGTHRVTGLVEVVNKNVKRGLRSVPKSWPRDVKPAHPGGCQMDLPLEWPKGCGEGIHPNSPAAG